MCLSVIPLKLSVTEDGLTAETGLPIKILLCMHIINPISHHDELPHCHRKGNT